MNSVISFMRIGQQGVIIWDDDIKIGIDLFLSPDKDRLLKNVVTIDDLADVDILFGTHDHLDHIDRDMWTEAAGRFPDLMFCAPLIFADTLPVELGIDKERFIFVDENSPAKFKGIDINAIPAAHEFPDESDEGLHPYLMYVITIGDKRICHMGDTCLYEGIYAKLRNYTPYDVMFLPINGRDAIRYADNCIGNMTYQEAADVTGVINPMLAVPGHYDMFAFNGEDPQKYIDYVKIKYPAQNVRICKTGEEVVIS
ncbi:MAG: MBL fold metallo-hydrolase [Lachnospiraceae bacterium]|nr:MBL fold metallo-hydrolase [Lachnospiraceae bacterium]